MNVVRVQTLTGDSIHPPFNYAWPDIEQLRWHAAVAMYDCPGLVIEVEDYSGPFKSQYSIATNSAEHSSRSFRAVWTLISGIAAGWLEANRYARGEVEET